jgi:putative addiction module component (TIGR02574 family)
MQRSAAEVLEAALALPVDERAQLAEKLVASLDGDVDPDAEAAWGQEIERRLARIEAGQSKTISMDESVARLHRIARGG